MSSTNRIPLSQHYTSQSQNRHVIPQHSREYNKSTSPGYLNHVPRSSGLTQRQVDSSSYVSAPATSSSGMITAAAKLAAAEGYRSTSNYNNSSRSSRSGNRSSSRDEDYDLPRSEPGGNFSGVDPEYKRYSSSYMEHDRYGMQMEHNDRYRPDLPSRRQDPPSSSDGGINIGPSSERLRRMREATQYPDPEPVLMDEDDSKELTPFLQRSSPLRREDHSTRYVSPSRDSQFVERSARSFADQQPESHRRSPSHSPSRFMSSVGPSQATERSHSQPSLMGSERTNTHMIPLKGSVEPETTTTQTNLSSQDRPQEASRNHSAGVGGKTTDVRHSRGETAETPARTRHSTSSLTRRRIPLQQPAPDLKQTTEAQVKPQEQSAGQSNPNVEIEESPMPRVSDLKQRLWDQDETLQVSVRPSLHDQSANKLNRHWLHYNGPEMAGKSGQRMARSLSPHRSASDANNVVFKSKFYHAAIAAKQRAQSPAKRSLSPKHHYASIQREDVADSPKQNYHERVTTDSPKPPLSAYSPQPMGTARNQSPATNRRGGYDSPMHSQSPARRRQTSTSMSPARRDHQREQQDRSEQELEREVQQFHSKYSPLRRPQQFDSQMTPRQDPKAHHIDASVMSGSDVASLLARLSAVNRSDPKAALAQIDSILLEQTRNAPPSSGEHPAPRQNAVTEWKPKTALTKSAGKPLVPSVERVGTRKSGEQAPTTPIQAQSNSKTQERTDGSSSDDDDETSVSSLTNPTYSSGQPHPDQIHDVPPPQTFSTAGFRRPRPSALQGYNTPHNATNQLSTAPSSRSTRSKKVRSPPPMTIKVSNNPNSTFVKSNDQLEHTNKTTTDEMMRQTDTYSAVLTTKDHPRKTMSETSAWTPTKEQSETAPKEPAEMSSVERKTELPSGWTSVMGSSSFKTPNMENRAGEDVMEQQHRLQISLGKVQTPPRPSEQPSSAKAPNEEPVLTTAALNMEQPQTDQVSHDPPKPEDRYSLKISPLEPCTRDSNSNSKKSREVERKAQLVRDETESPSLSLPQARKLDSFMTRKQHAAMVEEVLNKNFGVLDETSCAPKSRTSEPGSISRISVKSRGSRSSTPSRRSHPWDDEVPFRMHINPRDTSMENALGIELECSSKNSHILSGRTTPQQTGSMDNKFLSEKFVLDPKLAGEWNVISVTPDNAEHAAPNLDQDTSWVELPSHSYFPEPQKKSSSSHSSLDTKSKQMSEDSTQPSTLASLAEDDFKFKGGKRHSTSDDSDAVEVSIMDSSPPRAVTPPVAAPPSIVSATSTNPPASISSYNTDPTRSAGSVPPPTNALAPAPAPRPPESNSGHSTRSRSYNFFRPLLKRVNSKKNVLTSSSSSSSSRKKSIEPVLSTAAAAVFSTLVTEETNNHNNKIIDSATTTRGRGTFPTKSPSRDRSRSLEDYTRIRNPKIAKKFSRLLKVYGNDAPEDKGFC